MKNYKKDIRFQERLETIQGNANYISKGDFHYYFLVSGSNITESIYFKTFSDLEKHYEDKLIESLIDL